MSEKKAQAVDGPPKKEKKIPIVGRIGKISVAALIAFAISVLVNCLNCWFDWWTIVPW